MIIALTVSYWLILALRLPLFTILPGWFWKFTAEPAAPLWSIALLLALLALAIMVLIRKNGRYRTRLLLLIVLGVGFQFGFAWLEGRGTQAITDRIVNSGHAEFARKASQQEDIIYVVKHYESLLADGELGRFANSKPPGTLFFYMLTNKIAQLGRGENLQNLQNLATFLWPVISCLVLIPLFYFCRMLFDQKTALLAAALYIFVPSANLITLHTDQVIFPLLAMTTALVSAISAQRNNPWIALAAGTLLYLSVWFSFALIFITPLIAVSCYFFSKSEKADRLSSFLKISLFLTIGVLLTDTLFRILLDYDVVLRYQNAIQYHLAWKKWSGTRLETIYCGLLNLLEFTLLTGIPLMILSMASVKNSLDQVYNYRNLTPAFLWPLAVIATLLSLAFIGKARGEVARLWLFLVPFICLVAARFITTRYKTTEQGLPLLIIVLQFGTAFLIKMNQDFW